MPPEPVIRLWVKLVKILAHVSGLVQDFGTVLEETILLKM